MPLLEGLEELALGSASYQSAADSDELSASWKKEYPFLYHVSKSSTLSKERLFEIVARALVDAIMKEFEPETASARAETSPRRAAS